MQYDKLRGLYTLRYVRLASRLSAYPAIGDFREANGAHDRGGLSATRTG